MSEVFVNGDRIEGLKLGSFDVGSSKQLVERFSGRKSKFQISQLNDFKLNLANVQQVFQAEL